MRRFLNEWARLLIWGDNWLKRLARVLVFIVVLAGLVDIPVPVQSFLQQQATVQWKLADGLPTEHAVPVGWVLSTVVAILYTAGTFGAAWVLSQAPILRMADEVQIDLAYGFFRLRFENVGNGEAEPIVKAKRIIYEDGKPAIEEALWGFEMQWSHYAVDQRPKLSKGDGGATIGLIWIRDSQSMPKDYFPVVCGMRFKPALYAGVPSQDRKPVLVEVHAAIPGTRQMTTRWFGIEPDELHPLHYSPLSREQISQKLSALNLQ